MSVEAMSWAFAIPLPPCPKSILVALANRADEDGYCWPGIEDLERRTGWKRRAIQTAIRFLLTHKLIGVSPRFTSSGQQDSNLYRLSLGINPATTGCGEGAADAPLGVQQMHGEGAPHAPKSSSGSSSESSSEDSEEGDRHAAPPPSAPILCVESRRKKTKKTKTGQSRGHRTSGFPEGWEVEPWMIQLCKGFGLNPDREFAEFRNHHLAIGTVFRSWPHAFRTWVSRSVKFKERGGRA